MLSDILHEFFQQFTTHLRSAADTKLLHGYAGFPVSGLPIIYTLYMCCHYTPQRLHSKYVHLMDDCSASKLQKENHQMISFQARLEYGVNSESLFHNTVDFR